MKRLNVVVPKEDGGIEVYPMKQWLRQHAQQVPAGLDPTSSTSHQLRNGLRRMGWAVQETSAEVRLIPPGMGVAGQALEALLGDEEESEDAEAPGASFGLEYQLRDFLAQNLHTVIVDGKRLRLYVDPTGRDGIEYPTAVGPIDILAVDETGSFFVFELKRACSPDRAIGQLARYMGWVRQTIGKGQTVSGVIRQGD